MEKNDIASVLDEIATFMELTGENPFKIRAYSAGARILENMTEDLGELIDGGKLAEIPGLGEALVDKITTLRRDGVLPPDGAAPEVVFEFGQLVTEDREIGHRRALRPFRRTAPDERPNDACQRRQCHCNSSYDKHAYSNNE